MKLKNPFVLSGYRGPEYFCDRVAETAKLCSAIRNESHVTLLAPRRYGKTGLILNAFDQLAKGGEYQTVYVDVFGTQNLADFTKVLADAVIGRLDTPLEKLGGRAKRLIQSIRPTLSYDATEGKPTLSFDVTAGQAADTLKRIFEYLAEHDRPTVIAIDEFQQINEYPEKGVEAILRGHVQFTPARFIFAGSKRHLMHEMFTSPKRPFYQSTLMMQIDVIPEDSYYEFAARFFHKAGHDLARDVFHALYERFDGITWYMQAFLWSFYTADEDVTSVRQLESAVNERLEAEEYGQQRIMDLLPAGSRALLKAIAREGKVRSPQAGEFISKYGLTAPSSVRRSLDLLVDKELVYPDQDGYVVYDRLLAEHLRRC